MLLKADADYNPAEKAIFSAAKDGEKIYVTYNSVDYSKQSTLTTLTLGDPEIQQELTVRLEWADVGGEYTHGNASVLLQKKNGDDWETVDTLTLSADSSWTASVQVAGYAADYRFRERSGGAIDPNTQAAIPVVYGEDTYQANYTVSYQDAGTARTITNTAANNYLVVMDWEHGELGDNAVSEPVTVVLQHRENGNWVEAARQALSENGEGEEERGADWRVAFAVPIDDDENYRVRELDGQGCTSALRGMSIPFRWPNRLPAPSITGRTAKKPSAGFTRYPSTSRNAYKNTPITPRSWLWPTRSAITDTMSSLFCRKPVTGQSASITRRCSQPPRSRTI